MCIESIDTVSLPNVSRYGNISVYCCISNVHTDTLYRDTKAAIYRYTQIVYHYTSVCDSVCVCVRVSVCVPVCECVYV